MVEAAEHGDTGVGGEVPGVVQQGRQAGVAVDLGEAGYRHLGLPGDSEKEMYIVQLHPPSPQYKNCIPQLLNGKGTWLSSLGLDRNSLFSPQMAPGEWRMQKDSIGDRRAAIPRPFPGLMGG